jgi:tetratricopeptide (TPR) repeat protein
MSLIRKPYLLTFLLILALPFMVNAQDPTLTKGLQTDANYIDAIKARVLQDYKTEEELLKQVIKDKPEEAAPYYDLAMLTRQQKKIDQAEQLIKKAIDRDKTNSWYLVEYAEILEEQNKNEQAAAVYNTLVQKDKYNREHIFNASRLYEKAGKYKEAISLLDQLMQKVGNDEIILMQKQQLFLRMNDLEGAAKVAQQLIELNPREARYYANLADLYNNNGKTEKALEIYEKALKDFPNDASIQYGLAEYYRKKKDTARYDEYIRKAILNQDFDDETQTTILFTYLQELANDSTRKKESIAITSQLASQHPENPQILMLYGEVLLESGETAKAIEQYKKALSIDPSRFNVWQRLLFTYTDKKDADSLIRYSEKAMRFFPNHAVVHYLNGIGHYNKKEFQPAIKSLNRAIDLQPEDNLALLSDMYSSLGDIYNTLKNYKLSDSAYEKALKYNPANPSVLNNYAYYLSVRGERLDAAEAMSKKSLDLRPGEGTFLDTYGWILYKQGKYDKAKKYIEDAMKAAPDADGTLWEHLGDVNFKLGNMDKAVEYWKKAKEKNTENPQIDKKIQERKLYD